MHEMAQEEADVDIFCIGTELEQFVKHRPDYWKGLIKKIREAYKGKLTYAANWDEYSLGPLFGKISIILGSMPIFPLSESQTPSFARVKNRVAEVESTDFTNLSQRERKNRYYVHRIRIS